MDFTSILTLIETANKLSISLLIVIAVICYLIYRAQKTADSFDIRDLITDPDSGKVSLSKFGTLIALIFTTWAFTYLIMHDRLSETFYLTYVAVWTGYSGMLNGIAAYRSKTDSSTAISATSTTATTTITKT